MRKLVATHVVCLSLLGALVYVLIDSRRAISEPPRAFQATFLHTLTAAMQIAARGYRPELGPELAGVPTWLRRSPTLDALTSDWLDTKHAVWTSTDGTAFEIAWDAATPSRPVVRVRSERPATCNILPWARTDQPATQDRSPVCMLDAFSFYWERSGSDGALYVIPSVPIPPPAVDREAPLPPSRPECAGDPLCPPP